MSVFNMEVTTSKTEYIKKHFEKEIYFTTGYDNEDSRTDYYVKFTEKYEYKVFITDYFDGNYEVSIFKEESNYWLSDTFKWEETTKDVFDKKWELALNAL